MKSFISKTLILVFVLSFVTSPTLIHAAVQSSSWIFYPQTEQKDANSVRYRMYELDACTYNDKALILDANSDLKTTSDGENWETLSNIGDKYDSIFSNGKQIIAQGWRDNKLVSGDGKNWRPCSVQDVVYKTDGFDKFVSYPSWDLEVSDDGTNWQTLDLTNSTFADDSDFLYKDKGLMYYSPFISLVKVNDKYYMITDEGASIVSTDLINWTKNSPKMSMLSEDTIFSASGKYIICRSDTVKISKDAKNWQEISASRNVQWDGSQFIDIDISGTNSKIKVSPDGQSWKVIKELNNNYIEIIDASKGQSIITGSGKSWEYATFYQIKGDNLTSIGEFRVYGSPKVINLPDKRLIILGDLSTLVEYNTATVNIDDKELISDQPSIIFNGRTLVPLRAIFESLGAIVEWDDTTSTVTGTKGDKKIKLQIGNKSASVNDKEVVLDVPAKIVNDRTMVPARFIAESLGCSVKWDGASNAVNIETSGN